MAEERKLTRLPSSFELVSYRTIPGGVCRDLEQLLKSPWAVPGMSIREDPKRPGFYDIDHDGRTYFVFVYPSRERVMLLAAWPCPRA